MLVGVMDIVFTFGGQVNWMRYIISMRTPSKFPVAVAAVSAVMTTAYVGIGSVGCVLALCPCVRPCAVSVLKRKDFQCCVRQSLAYVSERVEPCLLNNVVEQSGVRTSDLFFVLLSLQNHATLPARK